MPKEEDLGLVVLDLIRLRQATAMKELAEMMLGSHGFGHMGHAPSIHVPT